MERLPRTVCHRALRLPGKLDHVAAVPRGTQVELDFTLPVGKPMKATGVVRWVRELNSRMPELMPGVGVQFTGLPE